MTIKRVLLGIAVLVAGFAAFAVAKIGPGNVIGMLRYDTRKEGNLRPGSLAPDVALHAVAGAGTVRIADRIGRRPLVLVFGSFTWPPFRRSVARLQQIYDRYGDRADFLTVYIREAHPIDEWKMKANDDQGICYPQPKSLAQRVAIAGDFVRRFHYRIPLAVDAMDNRADTLYGAWPERIYVIDEGGRVVYRGKLGPFGFHPEELEAWLSRRFPGSAPPSTAARNDAAPAGVVVR